MAHGRWRTCLVRVWGCHFSKLHSPLHLLLWIRGFSDRTRPQSCPKVVLLYFYCSIFCSNVLLSPAQQEPFWPDSTVEGVAAIGKPHVSSLLEARPIRRRWSVCLQLQIVLKRRCSSRAYHSCSSTDQGRTLLHRECRRRTMDEDGKAAP